MTKRLVIRTHDRMGYRRCRRLWNWSSHLRSNLEYFPRPSYFWIGTGIHYALEDFHGYNIFGSPVKAFQAYVQACRIANRKSRSDLLPDDWSEQLELGIGMLDYYLTWLSNRDPLRTLWIDGVPQVEVHVRFPLNITPPEGYDEVVYEALLDRVVEDDEERLWITDYKAIATISHDHLEYDPQITAYLWLGSMMYERPVCGFILQQHLKKLPLQPRILSTGKLSTDKSQSTTHRLYRECLLNMYGDISKVPRGNIDVLTHLASMETEDKDRFISRDKTTRNELQVWAEQEKVLMELQEMLNPNTSLYPNFTRDCHWQCSFNDVCLSLDRNDDWEFLLEDGFVDRTEDDETWRDQLQKLYPVNRLQPLQEELNPLQEENPQ